MKKNILKIVVVKLLMIVAVVSFGQEKIIHGIVTTFDSIPLVGAEIMVKSTGQIVKTDTLGKFNVGVAMVDKLKVRARGFNNVNVKVKESVKVVAINMKLKQGEKNRAYAIGYGHVMDEEKLNAVTQMTNDDLDFSQYSNIYDLIRGRFAGVQVSANGDIIIRGVNSINLSSAALIVVDGIPVDKSVLATIPPVQVKSINIMKDGSSAIYGSRGANGVVIIETKKGMD